MSKKTSAPAERNKQPLLEVLQRVLPDAGGLLLEIASGTGQHAAHFAPALPRWRVQPTDADDESLVSIRAWVEEASFAGVRNLLLPFALDVTAQPWPVQRADAIFNANMIHISPWECTLALLDGAGRVLSAGGVLIMYGPYRRGGAHTAPSNEKFERWLTDQDERWGVRDLDTVATEALARGLVLEEIVEMPANNFTVVYRRQEVRD
jgi:SAM-dependent methyltransferase